jgi:YidC/Oxa1 family membrane protein insertase
LEKRTLLALFLIFVVFIISNQFIWKNNTAIQQTDSTAVVKSVENGKTNFAKSQKPIKSNLQPLPDSLLKNIKINNNISIQNDYFIATFTNLGGKLVSYELKKFFYNDKKTNINLIPENNAILGMDILTKGKLENISSLPMKYTLEDNSIVFYIEKNNRRIFEKIFTIKDEYAMVMKLKFNDFAEISGYDIHFDSGMPDTEDFTKNKNNDYKIVAQVENSLKKVTLRSLSKKNKTLEGHIDWAAVRTKYFTQAIKPEKRINSTILKGFEIGGSPAMNLSIRNQTGRDNIEDNYLVYIGPVEYNLLNKYGDNFQNITELGAKWLHLLSKWFLWLIAFLYKFIPNYGVVIILFSIIIKFVLYPLTHKSLESTQKMQKLNPQMKAIQQKYKDDPKQQQAEISKLYKENGVSPLGGCLPMLLQMPVFFALYPVLRYSISLRQAEFIFWLKDLSAPDPYLILPILMAVFMFIQQKMMTPTSQPNAELDEKQQAAAQSQKMMMYIMPAFMFFIFKSFPSGLVLYWMIYNVLSIFQQMIIKKKYHL